MDAVNTRQLQPYWLKTSYALLYKVLKVIKQAIVIRKFQTDV
jgi:hypothetical protein